MKILVVEDDRGTRKIVIAMLRKIGLTDVIEADRGDQAWQILKFTPVDMVLTDWTLPGMDGLELVSQLRHSKDHRDLPILVFSSRADREDIVTALKAGIDTYLSKPFNAHQLGDKIKSIAGKYWQRQANQVFRGRDALQKNDEYPLLIFGEPVGDARQLIRPEHQYILQFIVRAFDGLAKLKDRFTDLDIGYLVECSAIDIAGHLQSLKNRVRVLMLSTQLAGGGVNLARLASINKSLHIAVFVVCNSVKEIDARTRAGLERLEITILERGLLDAEAFAALFEEQVVTKLQEDLPVELPGPAEIRRRLETDIRTMVSLPVLPQVYHQIVELDRNPQSDIKDWIKAIKVDPLSQAQIIRRARSPLYGFQGAIADMDRAAVLLGKNAVKEVVVAGAIKRSFKDIQVENFKIEAFWFHSLATGFIARLLSFSADTTDQQNGIRTDMLNDEAKAALRQLDLATRLPLEADEDPFIGGTMHDIGKVALAHSYPGIYPMIVEAMQMQAWKLPMRFAEETVAGGANHCLVGSILAASWKLGKEMGEVIETHHNPGLKKNFPRLIALADFLAGGIYPFPDEATYPTVRLITGVDPEAEGEEVQNQPEEDGLDAEAMINAAEGFLPAGILEPLELKINDLVALGKAIAPSVREQVKDISESI